MFFQPDDPLAFSGWHCVFISPSEQEAHLVASFLADAGIEARIFSRKDSTYVFPSGQMGEVFVYVTENQAAEAKRLLDESEESGPNE